MNGKYDFVAGDCPKGSEYVCRLWQVFVGAKGVTGHGNAGIGDFGDAVWFLCA
ncbi:hypothetical protein [Selenomonas ruminantium]|uniref:hypothetical protein n=1 Tax=Selenomonas ruminantium TaxID=971 RepID=UPI0012FF4172|nr:hypothetical protein [Selenomonas ruminantium]